LLEFCGAFRSAASRSAKALGGTRLLTVIELAARREPDYLEHYPIYRYVSSGNFLNRAA
jgi:hypothetical protein